MSANGSSITLLGYGRTASEAKEMAVASLELHQRVEPTMTEIARSYLPILTGVPFLCVCQLRARPS